MSQLHGKQVKDASVGLGKLSGTGVVAFGEGASMSFGTSSSLQVAFTPTLNNDVVNKAYVDSVATGLEVKEAVSAIANTASITLSGLQTIDGVVLIAGDRVIVNYQGGTTASSANGIYVVAEGEWTRAVDFNSGDEISGGQFAFVKEGDTYADTGWVVSLPDGPAEVGVTAIKFTQFSSAGVILAGAGLNQDGNTFNVLVDPAALEINGSNQVALKETISGDRIFSGGVTASSTLTVGGTLTANSNLNVLGNFDVDGTLVAGSASVVGTFGVTGNSTLTGTLTVTEGASFSSDVTVAQDLTVTGEGVFTELQVTTAPTEGNDVINLTYFGASYSQLQNQLDNVSGDFITAIEVGPGLTISSATAGTASISILDSTAGSGLSFTNGVYDVNLGDGLTFNGDNVILASTVAGNGLTYSAGVLTVVTSEITSSLAGNGLTANGSALDVNVDAAALEIIDDVVRLKSTITGNRLFSNNVTVDGDLIVNGTTTTVNTTELLVEDNIITLNYNATSSVPTEAGVEINLGNAGYAELLYNTNSGEWTAGLSGSTSALIQFAGTGLTKTGATLSVDTAGFADTLAGNGLTANAGVLAVNVNNGLNIDNDVVQLGGALVENTIIDGASTYDVTFDNLDVFEVKGANSTLVSAGTVSVEATANFQVTATNGGIKYAAAGYVTDARSLTDKEYVDNRVATSGGAGLSFSGTVLNVLAADASILVGNDDIRVQYDGSGDSSLTTTAGGVNLNRTVLATNLEGQGLTANGGVLAVELAGTQSGLTFSETGANGQLKIAFDTTTLEVTDGGLLRVKAGSALPVYDYATGATSSGSITQTSVTIQQTPNDYSRIEVYINGQRQRLYSSTGTFTDFDCWFGTASDPIDLGNVVATNALVWNPSVAGFDLAADDRVEIVYEV
jgi:cytoskeletal protein CcmA (bactofilin family)